MAYSPHIFIISIMTSKSNPGIRFLYLYTSAVCMRKSGYDSFASNEYTVKGLITYYAKTPTFEC